MTAGLPVTWQQLIGLLALRNMGPDAFSMESLQSVLGVFGIQPTTEVQETLLKLADLAKGRDLTSVLGDPAVLPLLGSLLNKGDDAAGLIRCPGCGQVFDIS